MICLLLIPLKCEKNESLDSLPKLASKTSHTAIMAHSLEIPAVVGVTGIYDAVTTGESLIVDGIDGIVHVAPPQHTFIVSQ